MRYLVAWFAFAALLSGSAFTSAGEKTDRSDELKWARQLVADFFEATTGTPDDAVGLLSPELAKSVMRPEHRVECFLDKIKERNYRDWKITSEEVSPDGNEMVFRGVVKGGSKVWSVPDADFKIRVAKDLEKRTWSIRFMFVHERSPDEKKTDKPDNAKQIIGTWECTKAEGGALSVGTVVTFNDGGSFEMVFDGKSEKGKYKIDAEFLELMTDEGTAVVLAVRKLNDTELVIRAVNKSYVWKRKG